MCTARDGVVYCPNCGHDFFRMGVEFDAAGRPTRTLTMLHASNKGLSIVFGRHGSGFRYGGEAGDPANQFYCYSCGIDVTFPPGVTVQVA